MAKKFIFTLVFTLLTSAFIRISPASIILAQSTPQTMWEELQYEGFIGTQRFPSASDFHFEESVYRPLEFSKTLTSNITQLSLTTATAPNIVFILTDDQPADTLGIAGNPIIKTPNIDSLATSGGMFFKNTYVATDLCGPSRSSLLTGKMSHTHGVVYNNLLLPQAQVTVPEILKTAGYDTALIGKCHIGNYLDLGFTYQVETGTHPYWGAVGNPYPVIRNGVTETQTTYHTTFLTDEALKYISERSAQQATTKKPFFLWLAFNAPHSPHYPPPTPDRYQPSQFAKPVSWTDDLSTKPPQQALQKPHQIVNLTNTPVTGKLQWIDIQYQKERSYEEISMIDDGVGRIKQKLQDLGISDNTIIIYMSDNGLYYGEHQLFEKASYFYEEQVRSPLIIHYPKVITSPGKKTTYVSSVDIAPTLLNMLGLPVPSDMQGKSLLPYMKGQVTNHRSSAFFEFHSVNGTQEAYYPMRGLAMGGYKLVHHVYTGDTKTFPDGRTYTPDGKDYEFYNLNTDPFEMNNLAKRNGPLDIPLNRLRNDSTYGRQVRQMLREIAVWQTNTRDPIARVISNVSSTWTSPTSIKITWNSPDALTSELVYKKSGCPACTLLEKYDFTLTANHSLTVTGLEPGSGYDFAVISISENGNGVYQNLHVNPQPTATPRIPGDLTDQGDTAGDQVNIYDYNLLVSNFGNPYTIFNYNELLSNFGK